MNNKNVVPTVLIYKSMFFFDINETIFTVTFPTFF